MFSLISRRSTILARSATQQKNAVMAFSSSSIVKAERSEMSNQDPAVLEREKRAHLKGEDKNKPHPEHAPNWNESLASESEANIKADTSPEASGPPSESLQKKTVEHVQEVHHKK